LSLALYYHTLRHLRPGQFAGRVRFALQRPRPDVSGAPRRRPVAAAFPLQALRPPSMVAQGVFRFLNETRPLAGACDWNAPGADRLWLYNLHYFDDLDAAGREARSDWHQRLISRWILENAPGAGTGWEPYPLSLRIVNWIKWTCSGFPLSDAAVHSLAVQARYLRRRLEYHLLGNHLLANAKALVFAGLFFDGEDSRDWLDTGLRILDGELAEQILRDGGHFERSPMYHSIVLHDVLDLLAVSRVFPSVVPLGLLERWARIAGDMSRWLAAMCHPDGDISFFNDAAFGIALTPAQLRASANALGLAAAALPEDDIARMDQSGYVRVRSGPLLLIFDAAPVGPDYIPGHAHADTLSFELSWGAHRVLTNSGTSTYAKGPQRERERSTAAHNTVVVDAESSSEVWDAFRVARRARPSSLEVERLDRTVRIACAHNGYQRLKGAPVHRRTIEITGRSVRVRDAVSGRGIHQATGRFHLHPHVRLEETASRDWRVLLPEGKPLRVRGLDGLRLVREEGGYAPEFGSVVPRPVLVWRVEQGLPVSAAVEIVEEP
jgi:uncharacterized heparinase superfamily protein